MFYPEEGAMMPQPKPRGGMFGGKAQDVIMAALAGFMSRQNPQMAASLMSIMRQKQQAAHEEQNYQRQRQDKRDDFVFEHDYEAQHPKPINNDTVNDYNFIRQTLGETEATQYLKNRVVAPPQLMNIPGVGLVQVPRDGGMGAPNSPPAAAVEHLRANPMLKGDFDAKYGPGAADRVLGGGGPTATPSVPFP